MTDDRSKCVLDYCVSYAQCLTCKDAFLGGVWTAADWFRSCDEPAVLEARYRRLLEGPSGPGVQST